MYIIKKQTKPLHAIIVPSILNKQFVNQLQPAVEPSIHEILDELPKIMRFVDYYIQLGFRFFFIGVPLDKSSPIFITLQKSLEFYIQNGSNRLYPQQTKGTALVFPSFMPHGVEPITKGIRYSVVTWMVGPYFK